MLPSMLANVNANTAASVLLVLALAVGLNTQGPPGLAGGLRGAVYTQGAEHERMLIPGTRLRIQSMEAGGPGISTTTDETGRFSSAGLVPGVYRIATEFDGMKAADTEVVVQAGKDTDVEIELKLANVKEAITVSAHDEAADTSETDSKAVLQEPTLRHAPNVNERVEGLLPLLPGVVRGPDGLINMKGAKASQGGMLLNSANVTDPVTGSSGVNLPIDGVSSAQVIANPYDPEYGKLAGAVAIIDTRISDFDRFHFQFQNFMPRLRKRGGAIVGIESSTPRTTLTGPLIRGRAALTQSFEYRYVRTPVETLPPMQRDTGVESFDSYTQLDLNLTERQNASITLSFYPQKLNYLGLNTFTPQPATPDLRQRGHFLTFSHKLVSRSESLLASQISVKEFDSNLKPHSDDLYRLAVETTTGGFFNRQDRDTNRLEWREVFTSPTMRGWGRHQLKAGANFVRNAFDGQHVFNPVEVLRASEIPAERIAFTPGTTTSIRQSEYTAFLLDKWMVHPRVTFDAGLRFDRDSISDRGHVAPRFGFAVAPFRGLRTVLRGGGGYFYDRINLNVPTFMLLPERTVTSYLPDGSALGTLVYHHRLAGSIDNPRSTAWNVEIQHEVLHNLLFRTGYSQRNTVRDFFIEPLAHQDAGALVLSGAGRNRYREFQVAAKYQIGRHIINGSYVRSSAFGDLNDFNQFFGNTPTAIIRRNERGPLPFDAPNRVLLWGQFEAPWKITLAPVLDTHTGFPYSVVNEERDFVGGRNRAGRFPRFSSLDLQVTKEIALPIRDKRYKAHVGFRVFNMLNHYNPRDLQNNTSSSRYGVFLNSVDRMVRGKFVLEFDRDATHSGFVGYGGRIATASDHFRNRRPHGRGRQREARRTLRLHRNAPLPARE